jgi:predicted metalloprotease with PDZ domain
MRIYALLPTVLATSAMISSLAAQEPRIMRIGPGTILRPGMGAYNGLAAGPRAVIGVTTTNAASSRDTLGVLVSTVRAGSPAEKAGIEEGNRIASINGVSLRLAAADIGDEQMAGVLSRRLGRELDKLKPGDDVELRVYASGQYKTVKVKTVSPETTYAVRSPRSMDDRATLGINLAVTGSSRDTLGVFVLAVDDGGPAAKAGIEEGTRIASINGIDVRWRRTPDDDDFLVRTTNIGRFEREVQRLHPGDDVELKVYFNGQTRTVKLKAARLSDLPHRSHSVTIMGGDNFMLPDLTGRVDGIRIDGARIGDEIRRAMESAGTGIGRAFGRLGGRMSW